MFNNLYHSMGKVTIQQSGDFYFISSENKGDDLHKMSNLFSVKHKENISVLCLLENVTNMLSVKKHFVYMQHHT